MSDKTGSLNQSQIFNAFMVATWGEATEAEGAPDYSTFNDACLVASAMGAKAQGKQVNDAGDGDAGSEWLFPDGTSVWIVTNGDGVGVGTVMPDGTGQLP